MRPSRAADKEPPLGRVSQPDPPQRGLLRDVHLVHAIPDAPLHHLHAAHLRLEEPGRGALEGRQEDGLLRGGLVNLLV